MKRPEIARTCLGSLVVVFLALSCGRSETPPVAELAVVPQPDLAGAEPRVRQQLTEARSLLDKRVEAWDRVDPGLGSAFGEMGLLYHGYDLLDPAEVCYRNARMLEPRNRDWAYLLGLVLQRRGRFDEAATTLEAALELQPHDAPALLHLGQVEQQRNRPARARALFTEALATEPACHAARFGLAEVAQNEGDLEAAAELFEDVLRAQPGAAQVHYPLAQVLLRLGRTDDAQRHLDSVANRTLKVGGRAACPDPLGTQLAELRTGSAAAMRRGLQLGLAGGIDQELRLLRQAVEESPADPRGRMRLGNLLLGRGDLEGAQREFQEAARLQPGNPEIYSSLGVAFMRGGRPDDATEQFRQALDINPSSSHYQLQLAAALQAQGACPEAIELYGRVLETQPAHAQALLQRGLCLGKAGRMTEAARDMALLLEVQPPEDPAQHLQLASMLLSLGEVDTAVRHFTLIADSGAPATIRAQAHILAGRVDLQRGDSAAAEKNFRAASALDPSLPQPPPRR